jgi:UDP-N-acetylglucosamine 4,6-dehydratase/5-epimerase
MDLDFFSGKAILITGGTGSLGKALTRILLQNTSVRKIAIFSRDELKQHDMKSEFNNDPRLRWLLGDIRDLSRLEIAFHDIDFVIHAAALKQVDTGEYNPMEFIKTNILGSQNVIDASIKSQVSKVLALSTDKASSPINLYGATKLTADKLFVAANNYSQGFGTSLCVVRYGNVMGSRGSVIPVFQKLAASGQPITITDKRMTRFWISLDAAANFVLESLTLMEGGELYVPRIPSMRIIDLAETVAPNSPIIEVGIRPGEKLHEEMISKEDIRRTRIVSENRLVVLPVIAEWDYKETIGQEVLNEAAYSSDTNDLWMTKEQLGELIRTLDN